jgi:hypothetical protein
MRRLDERVLGRPAALAARGSTGLGHELVVRRAGRQRVDRKAMPQDQWLALLGRYWQAVREGW